MRLNPTALSAALAVAGACTWFVISTITMDQVPDTALMAMSLLGALVFVSAFAGTASVERIRSAPRSDLALAALAGIMTWLAPALIVLSQRATDAPSGTEMLFFTTAAWAMLGSLVALCWRTERPKTTQVAAVALSLLGTAVILANWERPSSFSPFVKFPLPETIMLAAGILFALGLMMGKRSGGVLGTRTSLWIGMAAAAVVAVVVALPSGFGSLFTLQRLWPQLLLAGASIATLATGMTALVRVSGLARATSWLLVAPVAITVLSIVERLTVVYGPNPLIWSGVLGGGLLVILGMVIVHGYPASAPIAKTPAAPQEPAAFARLMQGARALAAAAVLLGAIAMFLPAFSATAVGTLDSGGAFAVTWNMLGAESAVGWLALLGSLLVLALAFDVRRTGSVRHLMFAAVCASLVVAAYPLLTTTPLRTWNRWIPAEIQQAYGTEYARLSIDAVPNMAGLLSAAIALAAGITLIVVAVRGRQVHEPVAHTSEENV